MKTKQLISLMKVISWIVFIGLCIITGAILISFIVSLFINDEAAKNLYLGMDLHELYEYSTRYYLYIMSFVISIALVKTYIFYLVIKLFQKIDFENPFTTTITDIISNISYFCLSAGIIAAIAKGYSSWLFKRGVEFQIDWGSSEFLFMAGIIFIIGLILKRGVEIQTENDLTI